MTLNPIRSNMTELNINGHTILFSYKTPVAVKHFDGTIYRTDKRWSNTTTRHINQWLNGYFGAVLKPQEFFDSLIAEVK